MDTKTNGSNPDHTRPPWVSGFARLCDVEDEQWLAVAERARMVELPRDYRVFSEGDACNNYILVVDGATRVYKSFESGREMLLYRLQGGQTCILTTSVLLAPDGPYPADALTEAPTLAVLIPARDFHLAFEHSKGFRDYVCSSFGGRVRELIMLLEGVVARQVDVRLARWLISNHTPEGISVSHRELAYELGTAREVISRQLKDFEKRGWLELSRKNIQVLDAGALQRVMDGRE